MDGYHKDLAEEAGEDQILYISGKAKTGADALVIQWCRDRGHPWVEVPADWDNVDVPGALLRYTKQGKPFNAAAGYIRNEEMAKIATDLIVYWDLKSRGTKHMYSLRKKYKLNASVVAIDTEEENLEESV